MRWSLLVLGVVAASPFALLRCKSASEPPPAAPIASTTVAPTNAASGAIADAAIVVSDASAFTMPAPPKYDPSACPPIESALTKVWTDKACKGDADCAIGYGYCSCGAPIAARALPKLESVNSAFNEHGCFMKHPIPCPSCPPSPKPKCVGGRCS